MGYFWCIKYKHNWKRKRGKRKGKGSPALVGVGEGFWPTRARASWLSRPTKGKQRVRMDGAVGTGPRAREREGGDDIRG